MTDDPAGHYAALEVNPAAAPGVITAAFRRKARLLHPDVVGTGDVAAFMRVKAAYDVLGDGDRRAAYDRTARGLATVRNGAPPALETVPRGPRLSDLPLTLWIGLGGLFCLATVMAVVQFSRSSPQPRAAHIQPLTPAPAALDLPVQPPAAPSVSGPTTHYVLPASGDAVLWRHDAAHDSYLPAGRVAAFSPVRALRLVPRHGLMEIDLADGSSGFIDASRLSPGGRAEARRAYCAFNAGASPRNGEVLTRHGDGTARLEINNREAQSAVVKLRDASEHAVVSVYLAPGETVVVANLPNVMYRPDFATGEIWSRACNSFAAGMRARRLAFYQSVPALSPLAIPPALSVAPAPVDIPDAAFERE